MLYIFDFLLFKKNLRGGFRMDRKKMDSILKKISTRHKITRRQFLKGAVGTAAAGATMMAMPWKGNDLFAGGGKDKVGKENPIKIGYMGAMNFDLSVGGWRALEIGVDEINEAGGVLGRPLQLVGPYSDEGRPEEAIKVYEKLVWTDEVDFVIEGLLDDSSVAIMERVSQTDVITIGSWVSTIECYDKPWQDYEKYKNWFGGVSQDWGLVLSIKDFVENFLKKEHGWTSAVIFREDLVWTEGAAEFCYDEFPPIGVDIKGDVVFPIDTVDFAPLFDQCIKSGADGIICFLAAVATVPLAHYMKLEVPMLMAGVNTDAGMFEFYENSGGSTGAAAQYTSFPGKQSDRTLAFMDKFWKKYNTRPRIPEHCGFDAYTELYVLADAIERAGTIKSDPVIKELERTYDEFWSDWPWHPGGWFGLERPASPSQVPERYRRDPYKGRWDEADAWDASVAPHVWGIPEMVRWGEWQKNAEIKGKNLGTDTSFFSVFVKSSIVLCPCLRVMHICTVAN
jgi:branched-chain amino acid transport system substrate-binding protein